MKKFLKTMSLVMVAALTLITFGGCSTKKDKAFYDTTGLSMFESMSTIEIDTSGAEISQTDDYTPCKVTVGNCASKYELNDVEGGIRVRGNSTKKAKKKPYRIKFDSKQGMLGLNNGNKFKSWVLLAEWYDPSMVRNATALWLGNQLLGDKWYCSDFKYVEVYLNGEYNGVYLLAEQQQIDKNRIDIYEVETDYQGTDIGYLLECIGPDIGLDKYQLELVDRKGKTQISSQRTYEIKNDSYSKAQDDFIYNYLNDVFYIIYQAIYNEKYYSIPTNYGENDKYELVETNDASARECIERVFDIDAAVNMYLMSELVMNMDVCNSFYIYVDYSNSGNKKLTIAAPWDFDFAFGNAGKFKQCMNTEDYFSSNLFAPVDEMTNPWYVLLAHADWFNDLVKARWKEVYENVVLKSLDFIKQVTFSYEDAFAKNYKKWKNIGKKYLSFQKWTTCISFNKQADAAQFVWQFLSKRIAWLNTQWGN